MMPKITKKQAKKILDLLKEEYPDAGCALVHRNVYELIVCVVLSAQTTDVSVNRITRGGDILPEGEGLFDLYPDARSLAAASQEDVMKIIKTIGMYKTKSKNIIALARALCENHNGQVPEDYDALITLPGVGRKTANVVLAVGFGHQRIAVDTHVFRVSNRIGLACCESADADTASRAGTGTKSTTEISTRVKTASRTSAKSAGAAQVLDTEKQLMKLLPEDRWSEAHHSLIWHGRRCCTARNPKCSDCCLDGLCMKKGL